MEFEIEVGTDDQKLLIIKELEFLKSVTEQIEPLSQLLKVIIASDFSEKINSMEKLSSYRSNRGLGACAIKVMARVTKLNNGYAIVLSPSLYSEDQDLQTRLFIIFHELHHLINKRNINPIPENLDVKNNYLRTLYFLYDEYTSDRFAYQLIDQFFPNKSTVWENHLLTCKEGYIDSSTDKIYYEHLKKEIGAFRKHANGDLFMESIQHYVDELTTIFVHAFSLFHYCADEVFGNSLHNSRFVNEKTFALMNYLKCKFEEKDRNLLDGIDLITGFIENFGFRFEQRDIGFYCHVLDI
jgi:hypothetical protein